MEMDQLKHSKERNEGEMSDLKAAFEKEKKKFNEVIENLNYQSDQIADEKTSLEAENARLQTHLEEFQETSKLNAEKVFSVLYVTI